MKKEEQQATIEALNKAAEQLEAQQDELMSISPEPEASGAAAVAQQELDAEPAVAAPKKKKRGRPPLPPLPFDSPVRC